MMNKRKILLATFVRNDLVSIFMDLLHTTRFLGPLKFHLVLKLDKIAFCRMHKKEGKQVFQPLVVFVTNMVEGPVSLWNGLDS